MSIAVVAMFVSPFGVAQEPLCDPCVDPPMPRRHDSANPREVGGIATENMSELGAKSIDSILHQLPKFFAEETQRNEEDDASTDSIEADNAVEDSDVSPE